MALSYSSSLQRLLPVGCNIVRRHAGSKLVAAKDVRQKDLDHMSDGNQHAPAFYGGAFRFLPLSLQGLQVSQEEEAILTAPVPNSEIDVLEDGELLVSVTECKRRLNKVFGEANWNITPVSSVELDCQVETATVPLVEYALFVNRQFVSQAVGHALSPLSETALRSKAFMTPTLRLALGEEAKLIAFSRCCRDMLIGAELSSEAFADKWRGKYARQEQERRVTGTVNAWRKIAGLN